MSACSKVSEEPAGKVDRRQSNSARLFVGRSRQDTHCADVRTGGWIEPALIRIRRGHHALCGA